MRKQMFVIVALFIVASLILVACATPTTAPAPTSVPAAPKAASGKLRLGVYGQYLQQIEFKDIVAAYNKQNPNVQVEIIAIPGEEQAWNVIAQKVQLEAQQKKASWDVLLGPTPFIEPGALAKLGLVDPLDNLIPKSVWDDVYGGVLKEIKFTGDGKIYTFPWWSDVFGLIYRPSMLKEATGSENPPTTWDEVLATSAKIKTKYGDKVYGFGMDWNWLHRSMLPIMGTQTDKMFTAEGVVNFDDPAAKETLELMKKLYPYLPPSSAEALGSAKAFQSGALATEIYWQAQVLRAIQAKQPEADVKMVGFPKGKRSSTLFWTLGAMIPKYSENKEAAIDFMLKGLLDPLAVEMSQPGNYKIVPFKSAQKKLQDSGKQPAWAPPLLALLDTSEPIPSNQYFLTVEQPIYKEEIEKMILQNQSVDVTLKNMKERTAKGVAEVK
ncbi:MAG: extracellular solute-binding protein [Chloroflexi bacterium]|nr:extracellular solute-binding protein [Chloroflexota bacterium]